MNSVLADSHCHLNFPDFKEEIEKVISSANRNGVKYLQTVCTKISEFPEILAIAEKYDNVFASIGVHPHYAESEIATVAELVENTKYSKVVGIGESGLDYHYEHSPRDSQQESFHIHIDAAREAKVPLIVHTREADDDTMDILEAAMKYGEFQGLIHCFSSSKRLAERALDLGMYISVSGIITFKKSEELRKIIKELPLSRLLIETDAPFLAPLPFRGKRNEPAYVRYTAEHLAKIKELSYEEIALATTENFLTLFSKIS